jgi:O-antigen/teichoic acid export membrane protein
MWRRIQPLLFQREPKILNSDSVEGRSLERKRRIVQSAVASAVAKILSVVTGLISLPLTLGYLGVERYGMWAVISSLTVLLSFADLGIGNGLVNAVSNAQGRRDLVAIRRYVASGYAVLTSVALLILSAFCLAYPWFEWADLFKAQSPEARAESGPALAAFVVCFALAIPAAIVQRVQIGLQRGFVASLWQCLSSLLTLPALLAAIHLQASLPWLVLTLAGVPVLVSVMNALIFFRRYRPDLAPSIKYVSGTAASAVLRTGSLFFVLQVVVAVGFASNSIVIAQLLGASAVADYAVAEKLFALISVLFTVALAPLWPAYGEAIARGDHVWVRRTLGRSLSATLVLSSITSAALVFAGPWLIGMWLGNQISVPFSLMVAFGVWKVIEATGGALATFLNGAHVVKLQVLTAIATAIVALSLKVLWVPICGASGAVWGSVVAFLLCTAIPLCVAVPRLLRRLCPI